MKMTGQPGDAVAIVVSGVAPGSLSQNEQKPPVPAPSLGPAMLNLLSEFIKTQNFVPPAQEPIASVPGAHTPDSSTMFPTLAMLMQAAMPDLASGAGGAPQNNTEDKENVPPEQPSTSLMSSRPDSGNGSLSISPASSVAFTSANKLGSMPRVLRKNNRPNKRGSIDDICFQLSAKRATSS